jgi:hypothetical protein
LYCPRIKYIHHLIVIRIFKTFTDVGHFPTLPPYHHPISSKSSHILNTLQYSTSLTLPHATHSQINLPKPRNKQRD